MRFTIKLAGMSIFVLSVCSGTSRVRGDQFSHPASWATYDFGEHCTPGVNCTDPDGYVGCTFDGRYIYFSPHHNGSEYHGEVLRYDTLGDFSDEGSWAAYDPGADDVGIDPDGYTGAIFDGRYVYFSPYHNGSGFHGEVLRYDTQGGFDNVSSWEAHDAGYADGYHSGVFDGRYVYFAPFGTSGSLHAKVLRYDTQGPGFAHADSWATFDAKAALAAPGGYVGAIFDGRFVYFPPGLAMCKVLRFDTQDPDGFQDADSWLLYDPCASDLNALGGYYGGTFDGRYVYFAPNEDSTDRHGEVLRYDTLGPFDERASWATFDYGEHCSPPDCIDPDGYLGAITDGRYVYFVPHKNDQAPPQETRYHGEVLRYDTSAPFDQPSSWSAFDPGENGVGTDPDGYQRAAFDGRFIYFAPEYSGTDRYGEVLRYDTRNPVPAVSEWGLAAMTLLILVVGTLIVRRQLGLQTEGTESATARGQRACVPRPRGA